MVVAFRQLQHLGGKARCVGLVLYQSGGPIKGYYILEFADEGGFGLLCRRICGEGVALGGCSRVGDVAVCRGGFTGGTGETQ